MDQRDRGVIETSCDLHKGQDRSRNAAVTVTTVTGASV
jgi:hypothetical protein